MNTKHVVKPVARQWPALVMAGALVMAPLMSSGVAQAASLPKAPAWNAADFRPGEAMTLRGVVTRDLAGNQFVFRADDGRPFRVIAAGVRENKLANGQRVEVRGKRDARERDVINADSVTRLGNSKKSDSVSQFGVVTRDLSGNSFEMRSGDGQRLFLVTARNGEPRGLSIGDEVRVEGILKGAKAAWTVDAKLVKMVANKKAVGAKTPRVIGQRMDFAGTVARVDSRTRLNVRADNGQVYNVSSQSNLASAISAGDRVRVTGRASSATAVLADTVVLVTNQNAVVGSSPVNFWGKIETINNNGLLHDLRVRGDNGVTYSVHYRSLQSFRVGDQIHIIGTFAKGLVTAATVSLR